MSASNQQSVGVLKMLTKKVGLKQVPLRLILVGPFVVQIFAAVGLVGYISLQNGQKAVNDLARQLRSEITARIQERLQSYVANPHLVNKLNANAIENGQLDLQDIQVRDRHFWQQVQSFPSISSSYIINPQGYFYGTKRRVDGRLETIVGDSSTDNNKTYHYYSTNSFGARRQLMVVRSKEDPRQRPWYIAAVAILRKEEEEKKERRKKAQESSGKENKSGNGQRVGEAVTKKRRRISRAMPNNGYEGYKPKNMSTV